MNRTRFALLVSLTFVALLAPAASAKTLAALPDLVVQKVSKPPKTKTVGSKLRMVVKVRNAGQAKAGKSKLGLYLGKGKKHTKKDKRLKRVKVKPLAAGKSKKLKLRVTLPAKTKTGTYRLFACADDTKKVKEAKERNCRATRRIQLVPVSPPPPPPSPAPAFTMSDGLDWGFVSDAKRETPEAAEPVTLALTAANGIPGQAGYTRAGVAPEGFRAGTGTTLDFGTNKDDGQVTLQLPFVFPFGGVNEQTISVSTNGWVSFGSPAWDYWNDTQPTDYRGIQFVVGELERGLMPYWADLDVSDSGSGPGTVKQVVAPDNSWVAFQWDTGQLTAGGTPRRTFQLVLFPDGRFRFDYPGANTPGGNKSFVGYSLGTGPASADIVSAEGTAVPASSLLFTPNALPAAGTSAPGQVTATLPKGSSFVSASAGCTLTTAPGAFSTGLVTCPTPALGLGQQVSQAVTFAMPPNAPGAHTSPANFRLLGSYLTGGLTLTDRDEIDSITTSLEPATIIITPEHKGPIPKVGEPTLFEVTIEASKSGLDEPTATFQVSNATLSSVNIDDQPIECTPMGGSSTTCALPSGIGSTDVRVYVIPTSPGAIGLSSTAQALNAPANSSNIGVIP